MSTRWFFLHLCFFFISFSIKKSFRPGRVSHTRARFTDDDDDGNYRRRVRTHTRINTNRRDSLFNPPVLIKRFRTRLIYAYHGAREIPYGTFEIHSTRAARLTTKNELRFVVKNSGA